MTVLEEKGKNKLQVKKPFYQNKHRKNSLAAATGGAALRPTCPSSLIVRKVRAHGTSYYMPTQAAEICIATKASRHEPPLSQLLTISAW
jgi:hypothetical protein